MSAHKNTKKQAHARTHMQKYTNTRTPKHTRNTICGAQAQSGQGKAADFLIFCIDGAPDERADFLRSHALADHTIDSNEPVALEDLQSIVRVDCVVALCRALSRGA